METTVPQPFAVAEALVDLLLSADVDVVTAYQEAKRIVREVSQRPGVHTYYLQGRYRVRIANQHKE